MTKQNYFETLNASLASEGIVEAWDMTFPPIQYGETRSWTWDNGTKHGHQCFVYRDERGMYERVVHYNR